MAQIETLTTVWDARIKPLEDQLNKAIRATYGAASQVEKRLDKVNDNVARSFSGGARGLGEFKSAAIGMAAGAATATAALTALTIAFDKTREAMKFGDDLQASADKIQITAEALQELQYAADETDVSTTALRNGLEKLNDALGSFKAGTASKQVKGAFAQLGITPESLKDVRDANELLPILADTLGRIQDVDRRVSIAQDLARGLEDLLPLLRPGSEGLERLRKEAHDLGFVVSNETVKALAEADRQFEKSTQLININMRSAVSGLATDIAFITTKIAEFTTFLRNNETALGIWARAVANAVINNPLTNPVGFVRNLDPRRQQRGGGGAAPQADYAAMQATFGPRFTPNPPPASGGGRRRTPQAIRDTTEERTEQVNAALASTGRTLLASMLGLVSDIDGRAAIEREIAKQEEAEALARINKQIADLKDDKGISEAKKQELIARLEIAKVNTQEASAAKQSLADRQAADERAQEALQFQEQTLENEADVLQIALSMARTQAERRAIELQLLDVADRRLTAEYEATIASETAADAEIELAKLKKAQLEGSRGGREQQVLNNTRGPMEDYFARLPQTADEVNEAFQNLYVDGISTLIDGLAAASVGAADLGDVFRNTIRQMAMDANKILLQSLLSGASGGQGGNWLATAFRIGASAAGGGFGGGQFTGDISSMAGLYADGGIVRGPGTGTSDSVPAMLSNGEFVVNAQSAARHRRWLEMINDGRTPHMKLGGIFKMGLLGTIGKEIGFGGLLPGLVKNGPQGLLTGVLPDILNGKKSPGQVAGAVNPTPEMHFHFSGDVSPAAARQTGRQAAAAYMLRAASARKAGFS